MPVVWRIVKAVYKDQAFDGEGARLYGGRWNSPGVKVVYTADSPSLAALELLVQLNDTIQLPKFVLISAELADEAVTALGIERLPTNWKSYPAPPELQSLGDTWIAEARSAALRVPSVVEPRQNNYLVNPEHSNFARMVEIGVPVPYELDMRLLGKAEAESPSEQS